MAKKTILIIIIKFSIVIVVILMIADKIIHMDLSPVGNLKNHDPRGVGVIICLLVLMNQPPLWEGSQYNR